MTDEADFERRLRAADRPRPLPPGLRDRLEGELAATRAAPLPLEADTAGRLAGRLAGTGPGPAVPIGARRTTFRVAAVAAACLLVGAVATVAELGTGAHPSTSASRAPSSAARTPASTGPARPGAAAPVPEAAGAGAPLNRAFAPSAAGAASSAPGGPTITSLAPSSGPDAGGTWVTITGGHLGVATAVHFGAVTATFRVVSDNELTALSPPHTGGPVAVDVTTAGGSSPPTPAATFTYTG